MGDSWVKAINKPDDKAVELSFREAINSLTDDEETAPDAGTERPKASSR